MTHQTRQRPTEWTEGVCGDAAIILRDGQPVPITALLAALNQRERVTKALQGLVRSRGEGRGTSDVWVEARAALAEALGTTGDANAR